MFWCTLTNDIIVFLIFAFYVLSALGKGRDCDPAEGSWFGEGNLGQTKKFPWLGVLKVHIHEPPIVKIAVTGLVLVKKNYAIANALEIAKIPLSLFRQHSRAMFVPSDNKPWYRNGKDYLTHPDYEYATYNTIAMVELQDVEDEPFPFKPACWPGTNNVLSSHLYVLGYTDENKLLEKVAYKVSYLETQVCKEFYERAGKDGEKIAPVHYLCGFSPDTRKNCEWESGMVLATNATGKWLILGMSIHGPGCSAPARYLDLTQYLTWVQASSSMDLQYGFRKALRLELRRRIQNLNHSFIDSP